MTKMRRSAEALALPCFLTCSLATSTAAAATCEALAATALKDGAVTKAEVVAPGAFTPPDGGRRGGGNAFKDLPQFCRIALTLTPSSDSDIKVEVWLPASAKGSGEAGSGWNGKFQAVGNGGGGGGVRFSPVGAGPAAGTPEG